MGYGPCHAHNLDDDALITLTRCARVNKMWNEEAVPRLWRYRANRLLFPDTDLKAIFEEIDPCRRQIYANHIQWAIITPACSCYDQHGIRDLDSALGGLSFPRLAGMLFMVKGGCIPAFEAPSLASVHLDPHYEPAHPEIFGVHPGEWDALFGTFAVRDILGCGRFRRLWHG